jgi:protein-S-isoprenylcysteine O-methyltransferase Ste14
VFIPPPLFFVVPLLVGLWLNTRDPWPIVTAGSSVLVALGIAVLAAGIALDIVALRTFGRRGTTVLPALRPTSVIVASGPYRFTRNPMYVGLALAYIGIALLANTVWQFLLLPAGVLAVDRYVIRREERYLAAKFGEEYNAYRRHVRRWL